MPILAPALPVPEKPTLSVSSKLTTTEKARVVAAVKAGRTTQTAYVRRAIVAYLNNGGT
jgi:hypothetical protein